MKYRDGYMGTLQGRRPAMTRSCVLLLAAVFVSLPSWSPSSEDPSDPTTAGSRMLASGFETGVMRTSPTVATAMDVDRSLDRRPSPPLAAVMLLAGLGALALTVTTTTADSRKAFGAEPGSPLGSRAPPRPSLA